MMKWMLSLSFLSIAVVALSAMTSISLGALSHLFIILPGVYFFAKAPLKFKELSLSQWSLLGLIDVILLSVLVNWSSLGDPVGNLMKSKYFVLTFLGMYAYREVWKSAFLDPKKQKILLYLFLVSTTVATLSGLVGLATGFNPLRFKEACHETRACGLFGMYMTYGYGIGMASVLMVGLFIYKERIQNLISLPFLYACTLINILGLYLSFARGAWIGFAVALPFFFFKEHKKAFVGLVVGVCLASGALLLVSPTVRETFFAADRLTSNDMRISTYKATFEAFKEKPILGLGYRNFESESTRIKNQYGLAFPDISGHGHNNFLEHLASTGILGFAMVVTFHLFWLLEMYRRDDIVGKVVFPFIICFAVSGLFQYSFGDGENLFMLLMVYALSQLKPEEYGRL